MDTEKMSASLSDASRKFIYASNEIVIELGDKFYEMNRKAGCEILHAANECNDSFDGYDWATRSFYAAVETAQKIPVFDSEGKKIKDEAIDTALTKYKSALEDYIKVFNEAYEQMQESMP